MKNYNEVANEIATITKEKNLAYGDSFGKSGDIIKILYPNGVSVDQYQDFLVVIRVIDKLFRIATDKDAFGESPWKDIMGYSLLAITKDGDNK